MLRHGVWLLVDAHAQDIVGPQVGERRLGLPPEEVAAVDIDAADLPAVGIDAVVAHLDPEFLITVNAN